jgi:predicted cupin superfamily sugar epimerase
VLYIYVLQPDGVQIHKLGIDLDKGAQPQVVIPANHWFGARVADGGDFTLSSCMVAPGFDFNDFELGSRLELSKSFPTCVDIIAELTDP